MGAGIGQLGFFRGLILARIPCRAATAVSMRACESLFVPNTVGMVGQLLTNGGIGRYWQVLIACRQMCRLARHERSPYSRG